MERFTLSAPFLEALDQHARATGQSHQHILEQALLHYLQVLHALPSDLVVRPRITVTPRSGEAILKSLEQSLPSDALRDLLRDGD